MLASSIRPGLKRLPRTPTFQEVREGEVRTTRTERSSENSSLLVIRAKLIRRWRTCFNSGTSVNQSTQEDSRTPPAAHTCSAPSQGTRPWDTLLLTKSPTPTGGSFCICGFCREYEESTSGLEPLT